MAFSKDDSQQQKMKSFQNLYGMKMHYLFYNPMRIPHQIRMPLKERPKPGRNSVGCRVTPKDELDKALKIFGKKHHPSLWGR